MKKLAYTLLFTTATVLAACNGSTKTGGDRADSGSAGSSGPADSVGVVSPNNPAGGGSTGGTDTSTTGSGQGVANPTVDTTRNRP
jgi:predicted small secreted protein